jgi:succinate dehydrogenase / fumarate reductase cytochrome b subunit
MSRAAGFWKSTVGKKAVMAVSGLILFGFVFVHMVGNLQVYAGPERLNAYAELLQHTRSLLWGVRLTLLVAVAAHIFAAWQLSKRSWDARPVPYAHAGHVQTTYAARTMRWSGPILLLFIVYHLLHFTTGDAHPSFIAGDVYHNFVTGFRVWYVTAFYVLSMLALGLHLRHGLWSMLQSVGLNHPRYNAWREQAATVFTAVIVAGNISMPLAVLAGVVK